MVVILILFSDDNVSTSIAFDTAAINARSDRVGVRVKAFGIGLSGQAVPFGHARSVGVMGDSDAVSAIMVHIVGGGRKQNQG
jgi:hypothetical protein